MNKQIDELVDRVLELLIEEIEPGRAGKAVEPNVAQIVGVLGLIAVRLGSAVRDLDELKAGLPGVPAEAGTPALDVDTPTEWWLDVWDVDTAARISSFPVSADSTFTIPGHGTTYRFVLREVETLQGVEV